jgi:hypothetical protein
MSSTRLADTKAAELQSQNWKGTTSNGSDTKLFIGGQFVSSRTAKWIEVHDPVHLSFSNVFFVPPGLTSLNVAVHTNHVDPSARTH